MAQAGDVLLFQTLDGGNISVTNGLFDMTTGLETAVYLSLFSPADWYGNDSVDDEDEILSSETEKIISTLPNISSNYLLLEQAINTDLKWLLDNGNADSISVEISSSALNYVNIQLTVNEIVLNFTREWSIYGN